MKSLVLSDSLAQAASLRGRLQIDVNKLIGVVGSLWCMLFALPGICTETHIRQGMSMTLPVARASRKNNTDAFRWLRVRFDGFNALEPA